MDKYIFNETNGLWYELIGDYYFPCLTVPAEEEQPVGVWGQRHKQYLKEHRPALYNALLLSGKLNSYLADIDQQAQKMLDTTIEQIARIQGITETLKATDQMAWVGKMNNVRASVMEMVDKEIIYASSTVAAGSIPRRYFGAIPLCRHASDVKRSLIVLSLKLMVVFLKKRLS